MRLATLGLGTVVLVGVACGGAPPVVTQPSLSSSPPQPAAPIKPPEAAPVAETPPPPAPVAEPTALTDAQKKRDAALAPKIGAFIDAFTNTDAELSKDRKKVLFRSNRDGNWQAYIGDASKPSAAPTRLTTGERVTSVRFAEGDKQVIFTRDEGADENFRIYRVNVDGSNLTNLTPNEKLHRDTPLIPRLRANQMVYSAHDNATASTNVYVQGIRDGDPRKVYTDPEPGFVLDVSPDGSHALFLRVRGPADQVLFRLDLDEGRSTRIFPQSEKKIVRVTSASYAADGKRAFIATDDGGEGAYLLRIEPASGIVSGRYKEEAPPTAQLTDIIVSPKAERIAVVVDAGNRTETRILDDALKSIATVKSPLGTIGTGEFAPDGKSFTAFLSAPDKPGDVFDVDATTGAMKALRTDARPGLAALPKVEVSIAMAQAKDGLSLPINVYLPAGKKEGRAMPVVVAVHGGPAASARVGFNAATLFWTSQGYAVVEPNLRGSTGFGRSYELADNREKRDAALADLEVVNTWVRDQAWADDDRIVVTGASYGGYMTLMALTHQPTLWRAGIDLVGISDLRSFFRTTSGTLRAVLATEFGDPEKDGALLAQLSPITKVDKITSPLFVYQGQNDPRVPRSEADAIVTALRERKIPVEYMVAPNEGHSLDRRESKIEFLSRAVRFLDENLPKSAPAVARVAKN